MENINSENGLEKLVKALDEVHNSTINEAISGKENSNSIHEDAFSEVVMESIRKSFERFSRRDFSDEGQSLLHEILHSIDFEDFDQLISQEEAFSADEVQYDEQLKEFLEYITFNKEFGDLTYIRIKREGNIISYSRLTMGLALDDHKIIMTKSDNLYELYRMLKVTFGPDFVFGSKHEMMGGWSLLPSIGSKLILEISSDDLEDNKWIYDEIHNREPRIIDEPKKF